MPAKKYISKPLMAWRFDPDDGKQLDELSKQGINYNKSDSIVECQGNTQQIDPGSYITVDGEGNITVRSAEWFESRYEEYASTATTATARKAN